MSRRLVVTAAAAVALAGAVPTDAAERASGCLTLSDRTGDAHAPSAALYQPPATPGVDIESVTMRSDANRMVGTITVGNVLLQPPSSYSTRFAFAFSLHRTWITAYYNYTAVPSRVDQLLEHQQGIQVAGQFASGSVEVAVTDNTVSIAVPYRVLERILNKEVHGQRLAALEASTTTHYTPDVNTGLGLYPGQLYDTVVAPRSAAPVLGAACRDR
jgi:hypothetical protein